MFVCVCVCMCCHNDDDEEDDEEKKMRHECKKKWLQNWMCVFRENEKKKFIYQSSNVN